MSSAEVYTFTPLISPTSFRVFRLQPGQRSAKLQCSIEERCLDECGEYEAISYVWGAKDASGASYILCENRQMAITLNLEIALRRLRWEHGERVLWADGICINQEDNSEKSQQVSHMGMIYEQAVQTIFWLGDTEKNMADTFAEILQIGLLMDKDKENTDDTKLDDFSYETWILLLKLSSMPYFSRIWILQEVSFSRNGIIQYGNGKVDWEHFILAYTMTTFWLMMHNNDAQVMGVERKSLFVHHTMRDLVETGWTMVGLMNLAMLEIKAMESSDDRDKIFGLYSLFGKFAPNLLPEPDYSKDLVEVYTETTAAMLSSRWFGLQYLRWFHQPRLEGLPSWVIDWRGSPSKSPMEDFYTPNKASPCLGVTENNRLRIQGKIIGSIARYQSYNFQVTNLRLLEEAKTCPWTRTIAETNDGTQLMLRQVYDWADLIIDIFDLDWSASVRADLERELFSSLHASVKQSIDDPNTWSFLYQGKVNFFLDSLPAYLRIVHGWKDEAKDEWLESFKDLFLSLTKAYLMLYGDAVANLFILQDRRLGFSSLKAPQEGCIVAVLGGFDAPAVLRSLHEPGQYELLNFAWVTGAMHQDVWEEIKSDETEIILV